MKKVFFSVGVMFSFIYAKTALCNNGDIVVFSCDIKKKTLSVCKHKKQIIYKYGTKNKIELKIKSKPRYSYRQFARANYEEHLRFYNKGYDYIVYSGEFMEYKKTPYDKTAHYVEHNGVYVVKNKKVISKLKCNKKYPHMKGLDKIGNSVLKEKYIGY